MLNTDTGSPRPDTNSAVRSARAHGPAAGRAFGAATGVRQPREAGARRRRHRPPSGCRLVRSPLGFPRQTLVQQRLAILAQGAQVVSARLGVHRGHGTPGRDLRCVPPPQGSRRLERHGPRCLRSRLPAGRSHSRSRRMSTTSMKITSPAPAIRSSFPPGPYLSQLL